ncbi:cytochrome bd oxidase subunit II [Streptomyces spiroverticillatus]|uniref:Cytochrome bd oxidase subunit II n=1 Tax=Streptomyces finlayi TaxID=67296 RepID=A0A919CCE4_9ACTN|nr:cytochrome d ubiquinol oxidase subunit II [Streptomyces finlayi]GHA23579.1 cytochrome bd oxidase subunit II [Streptomyces spiroverticillatus]GHD04856.1 cytochrome bd oxidase subunit II [Streptomyces finlayi]
MSLETLWLALLGLLLSGYFVLGGYDLGVQMLHPFLRPPGEERSARNPALDAMAPFFLGNEVWLVAFTGILFGAFPHLEGTLLSGLHPLIVAILLGLVTGNAAVQLRGRARTARGRARWDALIVGSGVLPALGWGLVVGLLLRGVPRRGDGSFHIGFGEVFSPFVLACGVTTALLFAAHGAAFVALRSGSEAGVRAGQLGTVSLRGAGAFAVLALLLTLFGAGARMTNPLPSVLIAALYAVALGAAWWTLTRGHRVGAFAATSAAALLPVLLIGAGHYPYLLITSAGHGLTISHAGTDAVTLKLLTAFGVVLVPVILAYQVWSWRTFRGRTGMRHPSYF